MAASREDHLPRDAELDDVISRSFNRRDGKPGWWVADAFASISLSKMREIVNDDAWILNAKRQEE